MKDNKPAHIMKASRMLQAKVGVGNVKEEAIRKSQEIIDNNDVDFAPLAEEEVLKLRNAIAEAREQDSVSDFDKEHLIKPVMQLKSNAAMFQFALISKMSGILMDFLEIIEQVDHDILDIIEANIKTVNAIVDDRLTGDGGTYGEDIIHELKAVIRRYFAKKAGDGELDLPEGENTPFYID